MQLLHNAYMKIFDHYAHYWVNTLGFLIRKNIVQAFERDGLDYTAEDWAVLLVLTGKPDVTMSDLSESTFRDKTTMTRQADRLVKRGLVERKNDANDRRTTRLSLTPSGVEVFRQMAGHAKALIAQSTQGISKQDLDTTTRTLAQMTDRLAAGSDRGPSDDGI